MATKPDKSAKKKTLARASQVADIIEKDIAEFAEHAMRKYGVEVNEGRAIPALTDGMKPVVRRLVWSASSVAQKQGKSARLIGNVLGSYHPHGDSGCYGALVTQTNSPVPMFLGVGNWGSPTDGPAAMRYTETSLTIYGKQSLVSDYLAVTPMTLNYDGKEQEPVYLPSLLPNLFLNDSSGIGLGVTSGFPSFTPTSLLPILMRLCDKEDIDPKEYAKKLELYEPWGGKVVNSKENKQQILQLMNAPKASVAFESPIEFDKAGKKAIIRHFAPNLKHDEFLDYLRQHPLVSKAYTDKGTSYAIVFSKTANYIEIEKALEAIKKRSRTKVSFRMYVSDRKLVPESETQEVEVSFLTGSVPYLLRRWLKYRVLLEKDCIAYRIGVTERWMARLSLLIYACDHLDAIFKALRTSDPQTAISKALKISMDDAKTILDLRVRQLSKMDQSALKDRLAEMKTRLSSLNKQLKAPQKNVKAYFAQCLDLFIKAPRERGSDCMQWWLKSNPVTDEAKALEAVSDEN